ncbi:MAG: hypothetical protein N2643_01275 [Endomicrobia bacterium]|nr:hypothetical protein [Endomicrobiia bacterium]
MNYIFAITLTVFLTINKTFNQENNYINIYNKLLYGTKQTKINELKNINKLPKKDIEKIFSMLMSEQDPDICTELIEQTKNILPVNFVFTKIMSLLVYPPEKLSQPLLDTIRNYVKHFNNEEILNTLKQEIISENTNLQTKYYLITFLEFYPLNKTLSIINNLVDKQDIIRLAISILCASYSDNYTKSILLNYLQDEIADIRFQAAKSLLTRKNWETMPLIFNLTQDKFISEKLKEELLKVNDENSANEFLICFSLFEDKEVKKICLFQIAKYGNLENISSLMDLYELQDDEIKKMIREIVTNYIEKLPNTLFSTKILNKKFQEFLINEIIENNLTKSTPFLLKIYNSVNQETKLKINDLISKTSSQHLLYYLIYFLDTKDLYLKSAIISSLMSYNEPYVYSKIEKEIIMSKNERMINSIISSLTKIMNKEKLIVFTKLIINNWSNNPYVIKNLLYKLEKLLVKDKFFAPILPELLELTKYNNETKDKIYNIIKEIIINSNLDELRVIYPNILKLPEVAQLQIIEYLTTKQDLEFLPFISQIYYSSKKQLQLKILLCRYILSLTNDVSHPIILDSLKSKNVKLQLAVLEMSKDKVKYEHLQFFLPLYFSKNKLVKLATVKTVSNVLTDKEKDYVEKFLNDNDNEIKITGIEVLSKIAPEEFVAKSTELLKSKNEFIRKNTLLGLITAAANKKDIISDTLKQIILHIIKKDTSIEVKTAAIKLLTQIEYYNDDLINTYFEILSFYTDTNLVKNVQLAFTTILLKKDASIEIYTKGLISEKQTVKKFFLQKILELKPQNYEIKQQLKTLLLTTQDMDTKMLCQKALSETLNNNDFQIIHEIYSNDNLILKTWVLEQLTNFHTEDAEEILLSALKDNQNVVRQKAVEVSINFLNSNRIYNTILYILQNDPNYTIKSTAAKILKK